METCTALWIVAPINRAVDNKTAKKLLGNSFKRQLKYDGTYSAVTFICSKTDDISVEEAAGTLGIEDTISDSYSRADDLKYSTVDLKAELENLRAKKAVYTDNIEDIESKYDIWDELRIQAAEGSIVYGPSGDLCVKKRKRQSKLLRSRKNLASSDLDADSENSDFDWGSQENPKPSETRAALTEVEIKETLASLRLQKKQLRTEKRTLDLEIAQVLKKTKECQQERNILLGKMRTMCVRGRNHYSRGAIKQDFAMGVKE
jgi:hypothetical protein